MQFILLSPKALDSCVVEWKITSDPSNEVRPLAVENHMIPSREKKKYWEVIGGKKGCDTCLNTGISPGCAATRLTDISTINRLKSINLSRLIFKNTKFSGRDIHPFSTYRFNYRISPAKVRFFFYICMPVIKSKRPTANWSVYWMINIWIFKIADFRNHIPFLNFIMRMLVAILCSALILNPLTTCNTEHIYGDLNPMPFTFNGISLEQKSPALSFNSLNVSLWKESGLYYSWSSCLAGHCHRKPGNGRLRESGSAIVPPGLHGTLQTMTVINIHSLLQVAYVMVGLFKSTPGKK